MNGWARGPLDLQALVGFAGKVVEVALREEGLRAVFGMRLRAAREKKGCSQAALSELCGLRQNAVADFEQARHAPSAQTILVLAEALEVSCDYLLGK